MAKPYFEKRVDNEDRWEFISQYLSEDETLLDVGCAEGYFTAKAAEMGLTATGIESNSKRVQYANSEWEVDGNLDFSSQKVTPENVAHLPDVDVIFFLTVHQHFFTLFTVEEAMEMFKVLCDKTDLLFYEPRGDTWQPLDQATITGTDTETGETYEETVRIRRRRKKELTFPEGTYDLVLSAEDHSSSSPITVDVGPDRQLSPPIQTIVEGSQLELHSAENSPVVLSSNTDHYTEFVTTLHDGSISILDVVEVEHKGNRVDPVFALDTSEFEYVTESPANKDPFQDILPDQLHS